jgi:hypothetical protein
MPMRTIILATFILAIVSAGLAFAVPIPTSWTASNQLFYSLLSLSLGFVWLYIGAVLLFVQHLGKYKQKMRHAFVLICIGIALLALSTLQVPVISALNLWNSTWVTNGGIGISFVLAGIAAYFGVRNLAVLVSATNLLTHARLTLPAILVLCGLTSLIPHVKTTTPALAFHVAVAILAWAALSYLTAACILAYIRRRIGAHYIETIAWLLIGFIVASVALTLATLSTLYSSKNQDGWSVAIDCTGLVAGLLFLKAAQVFGKASEA